MRQKCAEHLWGRTPFWTIPNGTPQPWILNYHWSKSHYTLVALYRAMRLRFGYGFESCDANGPRNVKNTNIAKHRPIFLPPLLLVASKELVLKGPKQWQFLWRGVNKNGISNFLRSIGHFFFVRSNCWGPVTSENKCVCAPKPCIMRSFGLKMRQKQVRETFRKVCQTCFCAIIAVCRRDF